VSVLARPCSHEGIRWRPTVTVEKYSVDQTAWAERRLARIGTAFIAHLGIGVGCLHGSWLRELFPGGPEDGYAHDEGNSMVNGGLTNVINLLTGAAPSGAAGRPLSLATGGSAAGSPCVGVGTDGATAFNASQAHLANASGEGSANSWYQSMDATFPTLTTPATINGQSTFAAGAANFSWLEWCWVAGAGVPTSGAVLASVYATAGSACMMNRKIPAGGLGTKMSGAAWVFATTVVFSLHNPPGCRKRRTIGLSRSARPTERTNMFKKRTRYGRLLATAAVLSLFAGAGVAYAAVSGTPTTATNGSAGYNATTASAAGFSDNQTVINANQYGLTIKTGAYGDQLCNSTTGFGAQIGLLSNNLTTLYGVATGTGTIPAPGCPTGGVIPGGVVFPNLSGVPYGHHVWVDETLVKKVKYIKLLICILDDRHGKPVDDSMTGEPAAGLAPVVAGEPNLGPEGHKLYGDRIKCFIVKKKIEKDIVIFRAQDLDAPATPTVGDLAGVQTRFVHVPHGTVFDNAGVGTNENLTGLVACVGLAADGFTYPRTLAGPAAYVSVACQPTAVFEFSTASDGGGPATDFGALTTTEVVSPNATAANVAPNNSLTTTNTGPHGTAPGASAAGSHLQVNSANAPTS
jgi:hypothetical protein